MFPVLKSAFSLKEIGHLTNPWPFIIGHELNGYKNLRFQSFAFSLIESFSALWRVEGLRFRVEGCRVQGSGFRIQSLGIGV